MPEGPPPTSNNDDIIVSDDDIPMPEGPPPNDLQRTSHLSTLTLLSQVSPILEPPLPPSTPLGSALLPPMPPSVYPVQGTFPATTAIPSLIHTNIQESWGIVLKASRSASHHTPLHLRSCNHTRLPHLPGFSLVYNQPHPCKIRFLQSPIKRTKHIVSTV
jgi:hypothetical protein